MNAPRFTTSWWKNSARCHWEKKFLPLATYAVGYLELGVFQGRSSHWMLDNVLRHPHAHAWLVDPWLPTRKIPVEDMERNYNMAMKNLDEFIQAGKCTVYRDKSEDRIPRLPNNLVDICYIDGNHDLEPVKTDIVNCWPKIRPGGLCIFDDHLYRRSRDQVAQAVREMFFDDPGRYQAQIYYLGSKQICLRKPVLSGDQNVSTIAEYTANTCDGPACGPDARPGVGFTA